MILKRIPLIFVLSTLASCANYIVHKNGEDLISQGDSINGVNQLKKASNTDPDNSQYKTDYYRNRETSFDELKAAWQENINLENYPQANELLVKMESLASNHEEWLSASHATQRARLTTMTLDDISRGLSAQKKDQLTSIEIQQNSEQIHRWQTTLAELSTQQDPPIHRVFDLQSQLISAQASLKKPINQHDWHQRIASLVLNHANLQQAFLSLNLNTDINIVFDHDINPQDTVTIVIKDKPITQLIDALLRSCKLSSTWLDDNTLFIYPDTPEKQQANRTEHLVPFYLHYANATKLSNLIKEMLHPTSMTIDETLNVIVVRESDEKLPLVRELINELDKPEPEVMLDVEVLEIERSRLIQLGIQWPTGVSATVQGTSTSGMSYSPGSIPLSQTRHPPMNLVTLNFDNPLIAAKFLSQVSDSDLLANPKIRVKNHQSAKVLIGERVPVVTTTATANVGTSDSINYLDVGLKMEFEPTITLNHDVEMKLALEVSNILTTQVLSSGTTAYTIGTRNAATTLLVHDGQTQILAGLIQKDQKHSNSGIPGLNEIPILNRLFGQSEDSNDKTEVMLLVTPHVLRSVDVLANSENGISFPARLLSSTSQNSLNNNTNNLSSIQPYNHPAIVTPDNHSISVTPSNNAFSAPPLIPAPINR